MQKSYQQKSDGKMPFLTFNTVCKKAYKFFVCTFQQFFNGFKISIKFCVYKIYPYQLFGKIHFFCSHQQFLLTLKSNTLEKAKKTRTKCFINTPQNLILHSFSVQEAQFYKKCQDLCTLICTFLLSMQYMQPVCFGQCANYNLKNIRGRHTTFLFQLLGADDAYYFYKVCIS